MAKIEDYGLEDKYYVVKKEDVMKLMQTDPEKANGFLEGLSQIKKNRAKDGKSKQNNYIVVNTDEPYAAEVADLVVSCQ